MSKSRLYDTYSVFVGHIPEGTQRHELKDLFQVCGEVVDTVVLRNGHSPNPNYGFVRYTEPSAVYKAVAELNSWTLNGAKLVVDIAQDTCAKIKQEKAGVPVTVVDGGLRHGQTSRDGQRYGLASRDCRQRRSCPDRTTNVMYHSRLLESCTSLNLKDKTDVPIHTSYVFDDISKVKAEKCPVLWASVDNAANTFTDISCRIMKSCISKCENGETLGKKRSGEFMSALKTIMNEINTLIEPSSDGKQDGQVDQVDGSHVEDTLLAEFCNMKVADSGGGVKGNIRVEDNLKTDYNLRTEDNLRVGDKAMSDNNFMAEDNLRTKDNVRVGDKARKDNNFMMEENLKMEDNIQSVSISSNSPETKERKYNEVQHGVSLSTCEHSKRYHSDSNSEGEGQFVKNSVSPSPDYRKRSDYRTKSGSVVASLYSSSSEDNALSRVDPAVIDFHLSKLNQIDSHENKMDKSLEKLFNKCREETKDALKILHRSESEESNASSNSMEGHVDSGVESDCIRPKIPVVLDDAMDNYRMVGRGGGGSGHSTLRQAPQCVDPERFSLEEYVLKNRGRGRGVLGQAVIPSSTPGNMSARLKTRYST